MGSLSPLGSIWSHVGERRQNQRRQSSSQKKVSTGQVSKALEAVCGGRKWETELGVGWVFVGSGRHPMEEVGFPLADRRW